MLGKLQKLPVIVKIISSFSFIITMVIISYIYLIYSYQQGRLADTLGFAVMIIALVIIVAVTLAYLLIADLRRINTALEGEREMTERLAGENEERAEKEREAMSRQLQIYNAGPIPSSLWSHDLKPLDCNAAMVELLGMSGKEDFINRFADFNPEMQPGGRTTPEMVVYVVTEVMEKGICHYDYLFLSASGELIPGECVAKRIDLKDGSFLSVHFQDIRQRLAAEEKERKLWERVQAEQQRIEVAEESNKAKSKFLARMSHELRTPMNAILGMAELISREDISGATREQIMTIKQSGGHLLSIMNTILDISKAESGKMEIINTEYLFHSTIHDIISIVKMRMTNPDLRFAVYIQHDIPNELVGDEVKIRQILLNILSNALKYTRKGFFSLDITSQWISDDTIMLTITVKDTGIGIKQEDIGELFGEFNQFDLEKNRNIEGTGLGLTITKSLINLMQGEIQVSSVYGEGSEFMVQLPQKVSGKNSGSYAGARRDVLSARVEGITVLLYSRTPISTEYTARALKDLGVSYHIAEDDSNLHKKLLEGTWSYVFAEEDLAARAMNIVHTCELDTRVVLMTDSYTEKGGQDFLILVMPAYFISIANVLCGEDSIQFVKNQQMEHFVAPDIKVLLVDDIETNLKVGEGLLKPYGMSVSTCLSARKAIEAITTNDYDMVLMDHMMPEMDGVEAVKHIRSLAAGKYAGLPIIAMTANAIVGAREMFLQNGFSDFLSKPIETNNLNNILSRWIPKEKQQQPIFDDETEEEPAMEITIEGVDTATGITFSGGSASDYLGTLRIFYKDGSIKAKELLTCLENNDLPLYTTYVHALKSACANIGAAKLSEDAEILEDAGRNLDMGFIAEHNGGFVDRLKKLLVNIDKAIAANTEKPSGDKTIDTRELKVQLKKLKAALESFNMVAIDEASIKLQDFKHASGGIGKAVSDILQNALAGEYEQAGSQIEELEKMQGL